MTIRRLDHVSVVVEDVSHAIDFFTALGMTLEGRAPVERPVMDHLYPPFVAVDPAVAPRTRSVSGR